MELGLCYSITDIVEKLDTFTHEGRILQRFQSQSTCLEERIKLRFTSQMKYGLLRFFTAELGLIFKNNAGNDFVKLVRGKRPENAAFVNEIVSMHSLMIYTDLIEYKIIGNTKAPLLRCFSFTSKLTHGDIRTTGLCMNYHTFSNLKFRTLFKKSFIVFR